MGAGKGLPTPVIASRTAPGRITIRSFGSPWILPGLAPAEGIGRQQRLQRKGRSLP